MIQEDQILVGNVLKVQEKYIRKDEKTNKYSLKNPFKFESSTYKSFEERVKSAI
jgi:hypothetical protein